MADRTKKQPKPIRERTLMGEQQENLYVTFALYFVMIVLSCLLIFVYLVGMCKVTGNSMNPTLENGDYLLMQKSPASVDFRDIVTFDVEGMSDPLIKRVIGVEGDDLVFVERAGTVYVDIYRRAADGDGKWYRLNEEGEDGYISEPIQKVTVTNGGKFASNISPDTSEANLEKYKLHVDDGNIVVLGDNRNDSTDSRKLGQIPVENVSGRIFFKLTKGSLLERMLLLIYNDSGKVYA